MSDFPSYDESIPVLTEVVPEGPPAPPPPPSHPAPEPVAAFVDAEVAHTEEPVAAVPAPVEDDTTLVTAPSEDAWRTLEQRLVARVLERLQDRIGTVLEDEIRTHMAPVLDNMVARLALELHAGLEATVQQVVTDAVAQELAHLHWNPA